MDLKGSANMYLMDTQSLLQLSYHFSIAHEKVGGGYGYDLARSGHDLEDVHYLDLNSWEWSKVELTNQPSDSRFLGRCHAYQLVGSKLVMFGGAVS